MNRKLALTFLLILFCSFAYTVQAGEWVTGEAGLSITLSEDGSRINIIFPVARINNFETQKRFTGADMEGYLVDIRCGNDGAVMAQARIKEGKLIFSIPNNNPSSTLWFRETFFTQLAENPSGYSDKWWAIPPGFDDKSNQWVVKCDKTDSPELIGRKNEGNRGRIEFVIPPKGGSVTIVPVPEDWVCGAYGLTSQVPTANAVRNLPASIPQGTGAAREAPVIEPCPTCKEQGIETVR